MLFQLLLLLNWYFRETFFITPRYDSWEVMVSFESVILYVKIGVFFFITLHYIYLHWISFVTSLPFKSYAVFFSVPHSQLSSLLSCIIQYFQQSFFSMISCFPGQWLICFTVQTLSYQHWWPVSSSRIDNLLLLVFFFFVCFLLFCFLLTSYLYMQQMALFMLIYLKAFWESLSKGFLKSM